MKAVPIVEVTCVFRILLNSRLKTGMQNIDEQ